MNDESAKSVTLDKLKELSREYRQELSVTLDEVSKFKGVHDLDSLEKTENLLERGISLSKYLIILSESIRTISGEDDEYLTSEIKDVTYSDDAGMEGSI